jgi:hypothetical protein
VQLRIVTARAQEGIIPDAGVLIANGVIEVHLRLAEAAAR